MSARHYLTCVAILVLAAISVAGSRVVADEGLATVKGEILLDGKPLPGGRIFLFSNDDQFVGSKIKDGKFKMDRVAAGDYKVTIEFTGIPAKYSAEDASGLRFTIKAGSNDFRLVLTSN